MLYEVITVAEPEAYVVPERPGADRINIHVQLDSHGLLFLVEVSVTALFAA